MMYHYLDQTKMKLMTFHENISLIKEILMQKEDYSKVAEIVYM